MVEWSMKILSLSCEIYQVSILLNLEQVVCQLTYHKHNFPLQLSPQFEVCFVPGHSLQNPFDIFLPNVHQNVVLELQIARVEHGIAVRKVVLLALW